ncbi:MAG: nucleotidyl transferase AbiEii/AbiGii toxin family protein [Cyclobacteriaceae bacterium]
MPPDYLHNHKDFSALLDILEGETGIKAGLIEKDYWIMHVLYGLKKMGLDFELKGGTSLSKGYRIIDRFSEDIDIYIHPPLKLGVNENPKNTKDKAVEGRKKFYDWLADHIAIDGIVEKERDPEFDDLEYYRSGGIRLMYNNRKDQVEGLKAGILLEAGFDTVIPNKEITISSWAYEKGVQSIQIIDNRAVDIKCYHPGYTFVEKLQTIAKRFRLDQSAGKDKPNFMRQYYDVYCLLNEKVVLDFIGTEEYHAHKKKRFPPVDFDIPIAENEAFLLTNAEVRADFKARYNTTKALYHKGQPDFEELLTRISQHVHKL